MNRPSSNQSTRRRFLKQIAAVPAAALVPAFVPIPAAAKDEAGVVKSPNERWRIGAIGMRYQGSVITREATAYGDVLAICDVDRHVREQARASFNSAAKIYEDYRDLIARDDIDVVLIGAPDHWHAKMTIDACRSGKDVYVEKPLTLTIDEGRILNRVVVETGRVVQVGTWQRNDQRFRLAAEMIRAGRLGKVRKVTIVLGKNEVGGPFPPTTAPRNLNWDRWLGQAPATAYIPERCHYTFRYWFEYAGGEITDTGAHHLDIALWALGLDDTGPIEISSEGALPGIDNGYNVPQSSGDGYEDHPYIFSFVGQPPYYDMRTLENMEVPTIRNAGASGHAAILNEYDTLFLKRDRTPVFWTRRFFDYLVGPDATADQRFALRAYLLAGLTEFWRAFRFYAGVMYLAYLDADLEHSVTCANFLDPEKLVLQPHFEEYVKEAFKPLGVYIDSWKSKLQAKHQERIQVMMVNDEYETARGHLTLAFSPAKGGAAVAHGETEFEIPPLGQMTYVLNLQTPSNPDAYVLSATATWPSRPWSPVISRRDVGVVSKLS